MQRSLASGLWKLADPKISLASLASLACDAQTAAGGPCRGWNEFSNADLARFCNDVLGANVEVIE